MAVTVEVRRKHPGPYWRIRYTDQAGERVSIVVRGAPTVDVALAEAHHRLEIEERFYTITSVEREA